MKDVSLYLDGGRWVHRDGGQAPVLSGVHHGIVGQQTQVRLGLLQLHLGDGWRVLAHRSVVRVRVEHPMARGGGARVGNLRRIII